MKYVKKGLMAIFVTLSLLIIIPVALYMYFLYVHSYARGISIYLCVDSAQQLANNFMKEYGNRYFAFDLIYYQREQRDRYYCTENGHQEALYKLYLRYPDMREKYLAAIVDGILDSETKSLNRNILFWDIGQITGIDSRKIPEEVRYDDMGPYVVEGTRELANWWARRAEERSEKTIAVMLQDEYYQEKATGTINVDTEAIIP